MMFRQKNYEVLMRVQNAEIKITIPIPVDRPDKNGTIHTKVAIENAIDKLGKQQLPIIFRDNDKCTDGLVVGLTIGTLKAEWDNKTQTYKMTINGLLFYSGADIFANDVKDGMVTDFDFASIGLTV